MNVCEIVKEYLEEHGYDGLESEYKACFCGLGHFMLCTSTICVGRCMPIHLNEHQQGAVDEQVRERKMRNWGYQASAGAGDMIDDHNSVWGGAGPDCCRIPA